MIQRFAWLLVAGVAGGWGGGAVADDTHPMHHHFPPDVDAFHSVLAPIWHSPPGQARVRHACAQANEMEGLAKGIRSGDASQLVRAVGSLKLKCEGDPGQVDAALSDVHEAFHRLVEPRPAAPAR